MFWVMPSGIPSEEAFGAVDEVKEAYQEARQAYYMAWDELNQRVK